MIAAKVYSRLRGASYAAMFMLCAALLANVPAAQAQLPLTLYVGASAGGAGFGSGLCDRQAASVRFALEDGKFVSRALPGRRVEALPLCANRASGSGFSYYTGLHFGELFSVEAGYLGLVDSAGASSPDGRGGNSVAGFWHTSLLAALPLLENASAYGKIGLAAYTDGGPATIDDFPINSSSDNVVRLYGIGMEYIFANKIGLTAEWRKVRLAPVLENRRSGPSYSLGVTYRF